MKIQAVFLYLPCVASFFWFLSYLLFTPKGSSYRKLSQFLLVFSLFLLFTILSLDNDAFMLMQFTLFKQVTALMMIPFFLKYIKSLEGFGEKKGGIVGARANMFCADVAFRDEKYEDSANYWKEAAAKAKKTYIAPLAYFNAAVCYENLGNKDLAAENYKLAADDEEFVMRAHAIFSYGRVLESKGDYAGAIAAYNDVNDKFASSSWANLAKTRLISLKNEGKN